MHDFDNQDIGDININMAIARYEMARSDSF